MPTTECPLCTSHSFWTDAERAMQACRSCADKIGLIPMPPSRRPPAPCGRCNQRRFFRVIPREHSSARMGDTNTQISAPMFVTHTPETYRGWLLNGLSELPIEKTGVGLLEVYICRNCGAVEWYCADVEKLTAHPHMMTEEIDYDAGAPGPYR